MSENKTMLLNRIFSRNTFRQLIDEHESKTYTSVVRRYIEDYDKKNNAELISEIYSKMNQNYRNEYFYKNTLLNKLLLGIHSVNTTTALTEIPIAKSKADFLLINGKAVVYEIKTELDNFERLENQVNDYYKAFNHVAVVTCQANLKALENKLVEINKPVGIYVLNKNGRLSTIRKPKRYDESLSIEIIFKVLRKSEYEEILKYEYGYLPKVSQFKYYTECKKLFNEMDINKIYREFLKKLKRRSKIELELFEKVPYELKFLSYFMELKIEDYENLSIFLNKQYGGV